MKTLILHLPFPPSVNSIWRKGRQRVYLNPKYQVWKDTADKLVMTQQRHKVAGHFHAFITIDELRRRGNFDADNRVKVVLDYLQRIELIENDSKADTVTVSWGPAVHGCSVIICPVEAKTAA